MRIATQRPNSKNQQGYTLLELLVVLGLLGLILGLALPDFTRFLDNTRLTQAVHVLAADIRLAQEIAQKEGRNTRILIDSDAYEIQAESNGSGTNVGAPDGEFCPAVKTYTLTLMQESTSGAADLVALSISPGALHFNPAVTAYTVQVPMETASVQVAASPVDPGARMRLEGTPLSPGLPGSVPLPGESTVLTVTVTARNGVARDYTITVKRVTFANAALSNLFLTPGALEFDPETTGYSAFVANTVESVEIVATPANSDAVLFVNGAIRASGQPTIVALHLPDTETEITVEVVAHNGVDRRTYTLSVRRAGSNPTNTDLRAVFMSQGVLAPPFDPSIRDYMVYMREGTRAVDVTAYPSDVGATMRLDGTTLVRGLATRVTLGPETRRLRITVSGAGPGQVYETRKRVALGSDFQIDLSEGAHNCLAFGPTGRMAGSNPRVVSKPGYESISTSFDFGGSWTFLTNNVGAAAGVPVMAHQQVNTWTDWSEVTTVLDLGQERFLEWVCPQMIEDRASPNESEHVLFPESIRLEGAMRSDGSAVTDATPPSQADVDWRPLTPQKLAPPYEMADYDVRGDDWSRVCPKIPVNRFLRYIRFVFTPSVAPSGVRVMAVDEIKVAPLSITVWNESHRGFRRILIAPVTGSLSIQ